MSVVVRHQQLPRTHTIVWTSPRPQHTLGRQMYRVVPLFVLFLASAALATAVLAAPGVPTARWGFDETSGTVADDAVGSMNGTISGVSSVADGHVGRAFRFDGSGRVTIPDAAAQRGLQVTIDLWVRGHPTDGQVIIDKGSVLCGGGGYALVVDGRYVAVHYRDLRQSTGLQVVATHPDTALGSLWDGSWHHVELGIVGRSDGWGGVGIGVDGWGVASSPHGQTEGVDYAGSGGEPLNIGGADGGCGSGFEGDIDQVRLYDRFTMPEDRIQDEPTVQTSLTIDDIEPAHVDTQSWVDFTLLPQQLRPGRISVYVTADDGVERKVGALDINYHWDLDPDGKYRVDYTTDYGGESDIRLRYVPFEASSFTASEDVGHVDIAKNDTQTTIGLQNAYVADEPFRIGVIVHNDRTPVTGTVELWEKTAAGMVLRATGSGDGLDATLPARAAGTYQFEGRYHGSAAYLPSTSVLTSVTILPALDPGEVVINGGDATTDDPVVTVDVPATGAIALWISTDPDDPRRIESRPYSSSITVWLTAPWYGDDADGVRTVWIKWADHLNRWSEMKSDTIVLDRGIPTGTFSIADGAAYTATADVQVDVPVGDASSIEYVEMSNDGGETWAAQPYAPTVPWTLMPGNGPRTVQARWVDTEGRRSAAKSDSIVLDTAAPTLGTPALGFAKGSTVGATVPARVSWTSGDLGSGIQRFEIQEQVDGGPWSSITTTWTASSIDRRVAPGHAYRYRIRAIDRVGRPSLWGMSPTRRFLTVQESSSAVTYGGRWSSASSTSYWGGTLRAASSAGRTASVRRTGYGLAWVAPVGPTRGKAKIYINGVYAATVDLYSPTSGSSRIVFEKRWSARATRTIVVKVVGTAGHPRVDVDGFISLN